jgi:hypothetical protein
MPERGLTVVHIFGSRFAVTIVLLYTNAFLQLSFKYNYQCTGLGGLAATTASRKIKEKLG